MNIYIKLVRPVNALIVLLALGVVRVITINGFRNKGIDVILNDTEYLILILIGMMILGAGNVINDYFDQDIDLINKPEKALIPGVISAKKALTLYIILNCTAILLAVWLIWRHGKFIYVLIPLCVIFILFIYSKYLKTRFFIGNFTIAALCGLLPFVGFLIDSEGFMTLKRLYPSVFVNQFWIIAGISLFAFLLTLCRELVKDCQDLEGDRFVGARTIPIIKGIPWSIKLMIFYFILFGVVFVLVNVARLTITFNWLLVFYSTLFLMIYCLSIVFVFKRNNGKQLFSKLSLMIKLFLLMGLLFMVI